MSLPRSSSAAAAPSGSSAIPPLRGNQPRSSSVQTLPLGASAPSAAPSSDLQTTVSKLQQENHSLKRRLVQYASTLEQVTSHAKREISSSARARDDAIAAAADASALRQKTLELATARDRADRAARDAHSALADRSSSLSRATEEIARLRSRLADSDADKAALREARDSVAVAERRVLAAEADARANADRLAALESRASEASDRALSADRLSRQLADVARHRDDLADRADRASREASAAEVRDAQARAEIARLKEEINRHEQEVASHRASLDQHSRNEAAAEERYRIAEENIAKLTEKLEQTQTHANETAAALRKELDEALKETANRNAELSEFREQATTELEASEAVEERDLLRVNVRDLQEELEQSSEMLTRAAIDALGDKSKIRKLEEALGKARDELAVERRERVSRDAKVSGLTEEISAFEKQLDSLRVAKRSLTEECHRFQMQLHERDNLIVTKSKELEKVSSERSDRAFHADRVSVELSNAKNGLAKKESDLMTLNAQFEELNEEFKTTSKDLQDRQDEIGHLRRELSGVTDQLSIVKNEKDRLDSQVSELQTTRRKVQDLTSTISEKEEELSTVKRWYASLKNEMNESAREKKRLSDMLAEVSSDLQRANHELDLLRTVRKDQEALAARISHIGETSSRELNLMKQSQNEQAERLARNTVEEYQRRLEEIQSTARDEIAQTVAEQLRHDIMPHLMRVVDSKARGMVHALARHVESFAADDIDPSYGSSRLDYSISREGEIGGRAESSNAADTNVATVSRSSAGVARPSSIAESESGAASGYRSGALSYPQSYAPASTADSRWNSVLDASRVESGSGSVGRELGASRQGLPSPEPSVGPSTGLTDVSVDSNIEGKSDDADEPGPGAARASPSTDVSESADGQNLSLESPSNINDESDSVHSRGLPPDSSTGSDAPAVPVSNDDDDTQDLGKDEFGEEEPEQGVDGQEVSDADAADQSEGQSNSLSEDVSPLYSEGQPTDEPVSQSREVPGTSNESGEEPDAEGKQGEDIEEIDITEPRAEDDNDNDDDVGVDIEVEFDPRDLLKKGLFSAMVDGLEIVEDPDEDYDNYGHVDDDYDEEGGQYDEDENDEQQNEEPSDGEPTLDQEDDEDPASGEPPVLSEEPGEAVEHGEEDVDAEISDPHDSEEQDDRDLDYESATGDIRPVSEDADITEDSEEALQTATAEEKEDDGVVDLDHSGDDSPVPEDEALGKPRELDLPEEAADEDAEPNVSGGGDGSGELSEPEESEVRELDDEDDEEDEDTFGDDANYSGEHEPEGPTEDDGAADSEGVSGERVNVANDAFNLGSDAFQEMSEELRAVYQAYYTSGRGSSLGGAPLPGQGPDSVPGIRTMNMSEIPEHEAVPGATSDAEAVDMDDEAEPIGEESVGADGNNESINDDFEGHEYEAEPIGAEDLDDNSVDAEDSTVGATEDHDSAIGADSEQPPISAGQMSMDDGLTEEGDHEQFYDQPVSGDMTHDEPDSQLSQTEGTIPGHEEGESQSGLGPHDDDYDGEHGVDEPYDDHEHDGGYDYHDDYHDEDFNEDDHDDDYTEEEHDDEDLHPSDTGEHSESTGHLEQPAATATVPNVPPPA